MLPSVSFDARVTAPDFSSSALEPHIEEIQSLLVAQLCDTDEEVRERAGATFNRLHVVWGDPSFLASVLNELLRRLDECTAGEVRVWVVAGWLGAFCTFTDSAV